MAAPMPTRNPGAPGPSHLGTGEVRPIHLGAPGLDFETWDTAELRRPGAPGPSHLGTGEGRPIHLGAPGLAFETWEDRTRSTHPRLESFVSGHRFSDAENAPKTSGALAPATGAPGPSHLGTGEGRPIHPGAPGPAFETWEDRTRSTHPRLESFVSGHRFSDAENAPKTSGALAPATGAPGPSHLGTGEGRPIHPGAPGPAFETWEDRTRSTHPRLESFVSGHRFSDAENAPKTSGALAPALFACLALTLLAGCKPVGPNYNTPGYTAPAAYKETGAAVVVPPQSPAGGAWKPANPSDGMLKGNWWEIYQDPQLDNLEARVDSTNVQLKQALETYQAARDQVAVTRANLFPTLSGNIGASPEKYSKNAPLFNKANPTVYNDLTLGAQASWEPDFWGRVRRTVEQARANAQVSAADAANIALMLHAELAADYFAMRALDSQTKLLTDTVADLQKQLDLTQNRLNGGVATEVDVDQARTQLETIHAQLVDVGVARAQYEHAIGTIANYDLSQFSIPASPLDGELPKIPIGVPTQLLERRPDIAAAERQVASANAQIGIAVSAFYPNIPLTGTAGFQSVNFGTWIQGPSTFWTLGAQATELLFDAGQRHAVTDQARHAYEAQADAYRNTVFQAFQDVEDQLAALRILEQESTVEARAIASAQRSFNISNTRYKGGVTSYLEVLTAEQTLLQDQVTAISIESRQYAASVGLVRSLGGGWDVTELPK